jgi:hypothetical protein
MSELHRLAIPAELEGFSHEPCLLPGESKGEFDTIRWMIIDDIRPNTSIEWLWTLDLVELSWEILRYRSLKKKILEGFRMNAVEALLQRVDGSGLAAEETASMQTYARRNALQWREDRHAAVEIEARLKRYGFDAAALNAEVYIHARDQLEMFDVLAQRAQQRRMAILREMSVRREFAIRAKRISDTAIARGE